MKTSKSKPAALKLLANARPLIIGHRGFCAVAPENTLPSFKQALEAGADLVELDYHHSKDGVPTVIHDDTLDRTTNARKKWKRKGIKVASRTAAQIQTLDAGSWFLPKFAATRVPLLSEALDFICSHGAVPLIEHKSGDVETLVKLLRTGSSRWGERPREPSEYPEIETGIRSRGLRRAEAAASAQAGCSPRQPTACESFLNKVVVISFDWKFLREFHQLEPTQILGALGRPERLADGRKPSRISAKLDARWLDELEQTSAKVVVWNRRVSKEAILLAHRRGLKVWIYTVNDAKLTRRLLDRGVDGIITNRISLIKGALDS